MKNINSSALNLDLNNTEARIVTMTEWSPKGITFEEDIREVVTWSSGRFQDARVQRSVKPVTK